MDSIRIPEAWLKAIVATINPAQRNQDWEFTSSGGNKLVAHKSTVEDATGEFCVVDFKYNEDD